MGRYGDAAHMASDGQLREGEGQRVKLLHSVRGGVGGASASVAEAADAHGQSFRGCAVAI